MRLQATATGKSFVVFTTLAMAAAPTLAQAQTPAAQAPAAQAPTAPAPAAQAPPPVIQPLPVQAPLAPSAPPVAPASPPAATVTISPVVTAPAAPAPVIQPLPARPAVSPPTPPTPPTPPLTPPPPMTPPPVLEPAAEGPETSGLKLSAFVDAYYGYQTSKRGTAVPLHRAYAFSTPTVDAQGDTALVAENGFSLSFVGVDATYEAGPIGATISLRGGPSVPIYYGGDTGGLGIDNITQAYATWTPVPQLTIDAGQFGTIFGAEVGESWQNLNYTRGALYYAMQPFWHTGVRATLSPSDQIAITAMVVNGVNTISDDNGSPSLALQLGLTPNEELSVALGWFTTPARTSDQSSFDNFFDLVAALNMDQLTLVLNADVTVNQTVERSTPAYDQTVTTPVFWGVSLAAGYQATEAFGLALRGEFLSDSDNQLYQVEDVAEVAPDRFVTFPATTQTNLMTATATLDFKPVRGSNNLIIRWDNRIETSNRDIFLNRAKNTEETNVWFGSTIGVVVTTGN